MRQIKKIAITNEKGGVGKTMTAVNLSACLAQRGYRVLLIDADPQGYATLNYDVAVSPSLLEVLRGQATCTETVQTTRFGVDVLPSDRTLSIIEEDLIRQKMNGATYLNTLEKALEDLADYDFVIIDCPPQGGRLMDIVHYYADAIIMPMFAEDYGIHALTLKAEAIADIRRTINPNLKILGGLITMDERRGLRSVFREVLLGQDLLPMFNTTIRRNAALIRAVNITLPDSFQNWVATMRSRNITLSIILQNISQIKRMFPDDWESVSGMCDEILYLGGNEQSTHEWISKAMGQETIDNRSYGTTHSWTSGSNSTNEQNSGRALMDVTEVRLKNKLLKGKIGSVIMILADERPIIDEKYDLNRHPRIKLSADGGAPQYSYVSSELLPETNTIQINETDVDEDEVDGVFTFDLQNVEVK